MAAVDALVAVAALVAVDAELADVAKVAVAALPVVFWFSVGNVQFVKVPLDGVPSAPPLTKFPLAVPVKAAVIVPAVKFPEASRATIVDAVFAFVAFDVTVNVAALD